MKYNNFAPTRRTATLPADGEARARLPSLSHPYLWHLALPLACVSAMGCGGNLASEYEEPTTESVGLALIQRVDRTDIRDGDQDSFRRADKSRALLYGRRASISSKADRRGACSDDPRVLLGLVSLDVCVGAELFFRESFGGNGRTCSSCHPVTNDFTIDPKFISGLEPDDPLFVAENDPALAELEKPELLRDFGLVLVNPDGLENPTEKFVLRSVSHLYSMGLTTQAPPVVAEDRRLDSTSLSPDERLGWGGDSAPLKEFTLDAILQHATRSLERTPYTDFLPPTDNQLNQIEKFQLTLGRMNELDVEAMRLTDDRAEQIRPGFLSQERVQCHGCHDNAGGSVDVTIIETGEHVFPNFSFDTGVEGARLPILNELGIPVDGGFGLEGRDLNGDAIPDAFGNTFFNTPSLIEAVDTGPFFHTNALNTIEEVIRFYTTDAFGNSIAAQNPPPGTAAGRQAFSEDELLAIGRFLRTLNASFNCHLAMSRLSASFQITEAFGSRFVSIQRGLLELAQKEIQDALRVLGEVDELNPEAQALLKRARRKIRRARRSTYRRERSNSTREALVTVVDANTSMGSGLSFDIGEGTLMF